MSERTREPFSAAWWMTRTAALEQWSEMRSRLVSSSRNWVPTSTVHSPVFSRSTWRSRRAAVIRSTTSSKGSTWKAA